MSIKIRSHESAFGHESLQGKKTLSTTSSGVLTKKTFNDVVTAAGEKPEDIENSFAKVAKYTKIFMQMGYRVPLKDLLTIYSVAKGVLNEDGTPVVGKEPMLTPQVAFDRSVTELLQTVSVNITSGEPAAPYISDCYDAAAKVWNQTLTAGSVALLKGKLLKFNSTKADEGLWLMPTAEGEAVKISAFNKIGNAELGFSVPSELTPGASYRLRISARVRNGKTLRTAESGFLITIA